LVDRLYKLVYSIDMSEHMTLTELAAVLGITRATIYNRQASGELPTGHPEAIALWQAEKLEQDAARIKQLVATFLADGSNP
jgi:hypothetical protein